MRRWVFFFAAACAASLAAVSTAGAIDHHLSAYAGSYTCTAGNEHYSVNVTSQLDGKAIRVDSHMRYADSEYIVTYVPARNVYIAEYADSRGGYETMEGVASGRSIRYHEVYPGKTDTMVENFPSGNSYSDVYTTVENGKPQSIRETCTKR